jgi:DNA end-binding protein Ku
LARTSAARGPANTKSNVRRLPVRKGAHASRKKNPPRPPRPIWSGAISFGLVNVPVQLVSAKEQADLHFTMLDPSNLSPIGYKYYNKATGEEVPRNKTVKAYKYNSDLYVIMTDADFKKANVKATQTIDIENFVELEEIDPVFFKKAYYLIPGKNGVRGYKLLREALAKSKKVAIAKLVLHKKQHLAAVIPRGGYLLLELLNFAEDVKELIDLNDQPQEIPSRNSGKEIEMAERLIDQMTESWNPQAYKDTYRADILKQVQAKVRAGKATEITRDFEVAKEAEATQVVDLLPLLRKSLKAG